MSSNLVLYSILLYLILLCSILLSSQTFAETSTVHSSKPPAASATPTTASDLIPDSSAHLYVDAPTANCQTTITSTQVARAVGADGTQRPTQGWVNVESFPDLIESHWPGYSGNVWYQIRWQYHCPNQLKAPITFVTKSINMAGQMYINDELLWQDQSLVEPLSRSWNMPRYWNLPASTLNEGENIIWVRVVGVHTQSSGLGRIFIGDDHQVMPHYQRFWYEQRVLLFFNLIFSLTLGVVALLVWLFHRKETVFGWFALTSLAWVMMMINVVMIDSPFGLHTLHIARINVVMFFAYCVFSCLYAWRLAKYSFARLEKLLFISLASVTLAAIFVYDAHLDIFLNSAFFTGIIILFMNFLSYPFIAYKSEKVEAYLLAGVFILYLIIGVHDLFFILTLNDGSPWAAYTAPLTTLLIAIILAMRLSSNINRIERFNKTLEESVIHAKSELKISLSAQHHLELENTRLQERMNLAHDLHDGLGGSLVRSMAIIDQSQQNLSNGQFLSMLKLLRDDLRQIIDAGSSSSNTPPENPTIWGAAIRYRFVQIFDELDIHSVWHFPDHWHQQPTALECLTLLRVIEESLTNIIKHSKAQHVQVNLYFEQTDQLILEIKDDGIGFDVDAVLLAGISVGLRSMKIRLEKIGARMSIQSQPGNTCIRVVKSLQR